MVIDPFAVVHPSVELGDRSRVHSHAVLGDLPQDREFAGEATSLRIGERAVIREGATVHRATGVGCETRIGRDALLMTNSHVGHNCILGDNVTLISGSLVGGHCRLGDHVTVGGNTAVHQFVRIGSFSMLAGCSAVVQDVPPFALTDRLGRVAGVNWIGLRRAGFSAKVREEIRAAYRLLYQSGFSANQVVHMLASQPHSQAIANIIEFLDGDSSRGLCRGPSRRPTD